MTTAREARKDIIRSEPGFWSTVAVGGLLGLGLAGDLATAPILFMISSFCIGLAWGHMLLSWVDMMGDWLSFRRDPLPADLNVADRDVVKDHLAKLSGCSSLTLRARHLLEAWSLGWSPRQVIELASFQSRQAMGPIKAGTAFTILLLAGAAVAFPFPIRTWLVALGFLFLSLTVLARQNVSTRTGGYLESRLLAKLPGNIPQTAMTAAELADKLGAAIDKAFKAYIPQPEQTAAAMKNAVEGVLKNVASDVEKLEKTLVQNQSSLVEKWMNAATATTADLKDIEKALGTVVTDLTGGLSTNAEKMKTALGHHIESIDKAGSSWGGQLKGVLNEHAEKLTSAGQALAGQLEKIAQLEKEIQKVLHVQQVVDGTIKNVSSAEEFKQTLASLRTHLQESDTLLKKLTEELAKPKTIRLVEQEQ